MGPHSHDALSEAEHIMEVMWVRPDSKDVGPGGYYHAHEAHVLECHTTGLTQARLDLPALDNFCQDTRHVRSRAVITRVFSGCAVVQRGTYLPGKTAREEGTGPEVVFDDLTRPCERWGTPVDFKADGSGAMPSCEGELYALKINVLPLKELCNDYVRLLVVEELREQLEAGRRHVQRLQHAQDGQRLTSSSSASPLQTSVQTSVEGAANRELERRLRYYENDPYWVRSDPPRMGDPKTADPDELSLVP